jgi:hypothetical protein
MARTRRAELRAAVRSLGLPRLEQGLALRGMDNIAPRCGGVPERCSQSPGAIAGTKGSAGFSRGPDPGTCETRLIQ